MKAQHSAYATCTFCPKLCRFGCPVAEAESRETVTPWALMTRADDVRRGTQPIDTATAEVWQHCTGCGRCTQICKHDNPVADALYAARAAAVEAGHTGLRTWADAERPQCDTFDALPVGGAIQLLPGYAAGHDLEQVLTILRRLDVEVGRPADGVFTSGHRWRAAGYPQKAADARTAATHAVRGAQTVICLDANDVLELRDDVPGAVDAIDFIAAREPLLGPVVVGDVLYLDACTAGRGLGQYDAPRALLAELITGQIIEATMNRAEGGCCGAGAGYADSSPEGARQVAREFMADVPDLEVPVVINQGVCATHLQAVALHDCQASGAVEPRSVFSLLEMIGRGFFKQSEGS